MRRGSKVVFEDGPKEGCDSTLSSSIGIEVSAAMPSVSMSASSSESTLRPLESRRDQFRGALTALANGAPPKDGRTRSATTCPEVPSRIGWRSWCRVLEANGGFCTIGRAFLSCFKTICSDSTICVSPEATLNLLISLTCSDVYGTIGSSYDVLWTTGRVYFPAFLGDIAECESLTPDRVLSWLRPSVEVWFVEPPGGKTHTTGVI